MLSNCGIGRRLLRILWTARRSNQSIIKEINPEYSLEGLLPKLKLQFFGHLKKLSKKELTHWKRPWCWQSWKQEEKGTTEGEMVGWHHQLDGHEFEQAPGVGDGQGNLVCCSPWSHRESDTTDWLNWTESYKHQTILAWCYRNSKKLIYSPISLLAITS